MKTLAFSILALVALGVLFATDDFKVMIFAGMAFSLLTRLTYVAYRVEKGARNVL